MRKTRGTGGRGWREIEWARGGASVRGIFLPGKSRDPYLGGEDDRRCTVIDDFWYKIR